MPDAVETKSTARKYVELITGTGKDIVTFLRDSLLLILALLLLFLPQKFNGILKEAGFVKGSIAGFEWQVGAEKAIETSTSGLTDQHDIISRQKEQNEKLLAALNEVKGQVNDPTLSLKVANIQEASKELSADTTKIQASVQQTIQNNSELLSQVTPTSNEKYVVVFGGDAKLEDAKFEAQTAAPKLGITNATVQLKQGYYRTTVIADSKSEADALLAKVKSRRPDAYVVRLSAWCPNSVPRTGYSECTGR